MKSKSTNEGLTCGKRKDNSLDPCLTNQFGRGESKPRKEGEKMRDFGERVFTFSLDFPVIGPLNFGETRGKVGPHCKSYAWVPVLGSFDKLWEEGVFSYLFYSLNKSHFNG